MSERQINIITSTVPEFFGGRTQSLLKRARIFADAGLNVRVVTTNFNQNYKTVLASLTNRKYIDKRIGFVNIFDFFSETTKQINNVEQFIQKKFGNLSQYEVRNRDNNFDYYLPKTDQRIFSVRMAEDQILLIDEFKGEKRPKYRHYVSNQGQVSKTRSYVHGTWEVEQDDILDSKMELLVTFHFVNNKKSDVILYLDTEYQFKNETEFFTFFYDHLFDDGEIVINDARLLDRALLETQRPIQKIFQLHSTHLVDPQDFHSGIKKSYHSVLTSKKDIKIVTLTNSQREVIIDELPQQADKIVTIPHSVSEKQTDKKTKTHHAVIVSRIEKQKEIEDSLVAFSYFLKKYPKFILDIYGDGENLDNLKNLVQQLDIERHVIFHGYTDQPDSAYQSADFSIMSSRYEAFALNVLESIANGTQVVSYDINFGPKEILENSGGYIAVQRTPEELSRCMIKAVESPKNLKEILTQASCFSDEIFLNSWQKLMEINKI